ncbi:DUF3093 domain-containing protein [Aeromicrobium sp. A1-2]|uniref:DUF3093 domain-containing protein n=1 Tax=Aeromicrobium sp. A1-2 TaxID=2107713 RepID=UPI000E4C8FC0|nr:DUF3093 domain-containing protein [Aeromicrobium sp. A1-2]AXT84818.1 DUF3093 domain-containing protein [Aeromicrobium sp. A1-2]
MTTYRERLTAPISWWMAALAFAAVWGWVVLVVTTWPIAITAFLIVAAADVYAVWRYGSLLVSVGPDRLQVGRASIDLAHVGAVEPLHHEAYRHRLGIGADARAYLATRPYLGRGVLVPIDDTSDPAPYWLVSSRRPDALAAALGHTGSAPQPSAHETTREAPRGEEEEAV